VPVVKPALVTVAPQRPAAAHTDKAAETACPASMLLVEGMYCPDVELKCKRWLDPPGRYHEFRCAEYAESRCRSEQRQKLRFCIDRDEYTPRGESLPASHQSWTNASETCASLGKRVCMESEYNFACEGEEMRPYPYGFKRDPSACNADRTDVVRTDGKLRDLRVPSGTYSRCESPFGVRDLAGNLEEFVTIDGSRPPRPAMKGAYWQPSRNNCRAAQTAHDRFYQGTETGFRCCADAP
jgi:formylglycine-generating enzyme required for sulfatase activity